MPDEAWLPPDETVPSVPSAGATEQPGVEAIPEILERLESVEELAGELYVELTNHPSGGPWYWAELNAENRKELWAELDEFVTWLQNRILCHDTNPQTWVPECWYRHPDAVELLTALMVAHKAAYRPKTHKPSFQLTEWFSRGLWPTMEALQRRQTFKQCVENQSHRERTSGKTLTAASKAFSEFVADETTEQPAKDQEPADA